MKRRPWPSVAAIGAATLAAWLAAIVSPDIDRRSANASAKTEADEPPIALVESSPLELPAAPPDVAPAPVPVPADAWRDASIPDDTRAEVDESDLTLEQEAAAFEGYFSRLDALRLREGVDASWVAEASVAVPQALEALRGYDARFDGSRVVSIECGTTLCRVEADHDDEGTALQFMTGLIRELAPTSLSGAGSAYRVPETGHTVSYFARAETDLPSRHDPHW